MSEGIRRPESESEIQIVSGKEAARYLRPEDVEKVADILTEANFSAPDMVAHDIRLKLRELVEKSSVDQFINTKSPRHKTTWDKAKHLLYPHFPKSQQRAYVLKSLKEYIEKGNTSVLLEDGELAATASIAEDGGVMPDGRIIYEIARVVTMPECRNKGYAKMLMEKLIQQIHDEHPGNPILIHTRGKTIKTFCRRMGWKEGGYKEWLDLQDFRNMVSPQELKSRVEKWAKTGWSVFWYDPQAEK